jgi:hypothetical protein
MTVRCRSASRRIYADKETRDRKVFAVMSVREPADKKPCTDFDPRHGVMPSPESRILDGRWAKKALGAKGIKWQVSHRKTHPDVAFVHALNLNMLAATMDGAVEGILVLRQVHRNGRREDANALSQGKLVAAGDLAENLLEVRRRRKRVSGLASRRLVLLWLSAVFYRSQCQLR